MKGYDMKRTSDRHDPIPKDEKCFLALRKRLRKSVERRYPEKRLGWIGGVLFFLDTNEAVAGVATVLRSGQQKKGLGANPPRTATPRAMRRKSLW